MSEQKTALRWNHLVVTVDADIAAAHPRAAREMERDGQVSIVTAVELLELQWRKTMIPHPSSFTLHPSAEVRS